MQLAPERTGFVRVRMSNGRYQYLEADSFGQAASRIKAGYGQIECFDWISKDQYILGPKGEVK